MKYLLIIIAAIGYRLRGSAGKGGWVEKLTGFAIGTFLGRFLWCVPVALMVSSGWQQFILVTASAYFGVVFGYWDGQFDLEKPENRNWKNYAILSARGAFIPLAVCITISGGWWAIPAGAALPLYYLAGLWIAPRLKLPTVHTFSEWGELLLGASIALGLIA